MIEVQSFKIMKGDDEDEEVLVEKELDEEEIKRDVNICL